MSRKLSLVVLTLLVFALAACGGGAAGGGGGGAAPALDQTFNQEGLSFRYPAGWAADGEGGQAFIANSQDTLTRAQAETDTPTLNAGDRVITILSFDAETISLMGTTSPLALLQTMTSSATDMAGVSFSDPAETTVGGKPAARTSGSNNTLGAQVLVVDLGDSGYVTLIGLAPSGEVGSLEATLNAIAETVTVEAPAAAG